MSMIERLKRMSMEMFKNALKNYTMQDVIKHKHVAHSNVLEQLSQFPNNGVSMHLRRKHYKQPHHYLIARTNFKSARNGVVYSLLFKDGLKVSKQPVRMQGLNKRGAWDYDLGEFDFYIHDNNVKYTRADYEAFIRIRSLGKSKGQLQQQQDYQEQNLEEQIQQQIQEQGQ